MAFEISGKVIEILPVNQVSDKFRKREFIIERKESGGAALFIDYIKFQLVQDKCDLINESFLNDEVKVTFNIKGNRWERDGKGCQLRKNPRALLRSLNLRTFHRILTT